MGSQAQTPPALVRLLADLEAVPPSILELKNVDLGGDELGGYFTLAEHQGEGSYRRQVRLRVFTAIGNCRSLQSIHLNPHRKRDHYSVTEAEATAIFQGLQSNPVLAYLNVTGWRGLGTPAACEALAGLVRSSRTLQFLFLKDTGLTAPGLGHIAAALRGNRRSILRGLFVDENRIGDAAGAQHLADILASAPRLRFLGMRDICMDEAGGEVIANALVHNATLKRLFIGWRRVRLPTNSTNQSAPLSRILAALSAPSGAGGPAADAAASKSALSNRSVEELGLSVLGDGGEPIAPGLGEAVAHMLRSNVTLKKLYISTSIVGHGLEALCDNASITWLEVGHDGNDSTVDLGKLIPIVQSCKTLQGLKYGSGHFPLEFKTKVFRSLKDNPSIKSLKIDGWEGLDDAMFKDLMESLQVNTNLEEISVEGTSWKREGREATLQQALKGNKRQVAYLKLLHQQGDLKLTDPKAGRLFLCGSAFAGKTTLRNNMIRSWFETSMMQPAGCGNCVGLAIDRLAWVGKKRTQGIEIQMLRNDDTMQISIWDLAGQDKFRALQSFLFPSISQACVFFLCLVVMTVKHTS